MDTPTRTIHVPNSNSFPHVQPLAYSEKHASRKCQTRRTSRTPSWPAALRHWGPVRTSEPGEKAGPKCLGLQPHQHPRKRLVRVNPIAQQKQGFELRTLATLVCLAIHLERFPTRCRGTRLSFRWRTDASHVHVLYIRVKTAVGIRSINDGKHGDHYDILAPGGDASSDDC
jgi:hypothetical protein